MAKQSTSAIDSLWAKIKDRAGKAVGSVAKGAPKSDGFVQLPGGLVNAVAKFSGATLFQINSGKYKGNLGVRIEGTVVFPKTHVEDGITYTIVGQKTSKLINLCDTVNKDNIPISMEKAFEDASNALKYSGVDLDALRDAGYQFPDLCKAAVKHAEKKGGYFRFSTRRSKEILNADKSVKYPGRVWEEWKQPLPGYTPPKATTAVADDAPADDLPADPADDEVPVDQPDDGTGDASDAMGEGDPSFSLLDFGADLETLVKQASLDNEKAKEHLTELALKAGATKAQIKKADSWDDVADFIRNAATAEEGGDAGDDQGDPDNADAGDDAGDAGDAGDDGDDDAPAPTFEDGVVVLYKAWDATAKRSLAPVEALVLGSDEEKERVDIRVGNKTLRGIPFARVEHKPVTKPAAKPAAASKPAPKKAGK